jgi:hypothetical protein
MRLKAINILSLIVLSAGIATIFFTIGCKASQKVSEKTGVQLWSENCRRCHNTPSPNTFSPAQWETIGLHMQTRALLTDDE